jgi:beta-lactamase regulating signal transducer with metallopeptidase domain
MKKNANIVFTLLIWVLSIFSLAAQPTFTDKLGTGNVVIGFVIVVVVIFWFICFREIFDWFKYRSPKNNGLESGDELVKKAKEDAKSSVVIRGRRY